MSSTPSVSAARTAHIDHLSNLLDQELNKALKKTPSAPPPKTKGAATQSSVPQLPTPNLSPEDVMLILNQLNESTFQSDISSQEQGVNVRKAQMRSLHKKNIKKLKDAEQKMAQQAVLKVIMRIFGILASIIAFIVSALVSVVSFGTASPIMGIAAAISATITAAVLVATESGGMSKLVGAIGQALAADLPGGAKNPKNKMIGMIIAQVLVSAVIITAQLGLAIFQAGAGVAESVSQTVRMVLKVAMRAGALVQIGDSLASAGMQTASGVYSYQSTEDQAGVLRDKAFMARLEKIMEECEDLMEEITKKLEGAQKNVASTIKGAHTTQTQIIRAMSTV